MIKKVAHPLGGSPGNLLGCRVMVEDPLHLGFNVLAAQVCPRCTTACGYAYVLVVRWRGLGGNQILEFKRISLSLLEKL